MVQAARGGHRGRMLVWTIVALFASPFVVAAEDAVASGKGATATAEARGATAKEASTAAAKDAMACEFHLPAMERNKEYISQLSNLTLFKNCNTKGSYLYYYRWYEENLPSRRHLSRGLAVLVIVLGAILPVVVNWRKTEAHYKLTVSLIGALIVIAQGVSQTFAYDAAWRNFMMASIKLEVAHDAWQHAMIKASLGTTDQSLQQMEAATDQFAKQVSDAVLEETTGFFTAVEEASKVRNAEKPITSQ